MSEYIASPLAHIFNLSIEQSIYPKTFKESVVIPIYKNGSPHNCTNYRPISLISNLSKIFEKLIKKRLINYFEKNNIISNNQFGFRDKFSTNDAIKYITSSIYNYMDNDIKVAAIFLDIRKAFDFVDHNIFLAKLDNIGIRGTTNDFFANFLKDRQQTVRIGEEYSDKKNVNYGVLQGSVLGPIFFIIYINDRINLFRNDVVAFADDSTIICKEKSWNEIEVDANKKINIIIQWLSEHKLILNYDKTVYITFSPKKNTQPDKFCIKIDNTSIKKVDCTKYLGIYIDQNLKWSFHIKNVIKKCYYVIYIIRKLLNILSCKQIISVYYALLESVITYGIIGWGSAYKTHSEALDKLHKKVIKIIYNKFKYDIKSKIVIKKILTIKGLYYYDIIKINIKFLTDQYHKLKGKRIKNIIHPKKKEKPWSKNKFLYDYY